MQLPEYVYEVLQKLNNNGYEAYCVGGCVRDQKFLTDTVC